MNMNIKLLFGAILIQSSVAVYAQNICDDVLIKSLSINTTGQTANYQTNCCPPTANLTQVAMTDSAGITEVWYNTNYIFIKSKSLARFTMGPWDTQLVPVATDVLFKIPRTVTKDNSGTMNTAESGTIGVGTDGVSIFSETTSNSYDNANGNNQGTGDGIWNEDAWVDESWSLDSSGNGHTNAAGKYHYHASPIKLYTRSNSAHSPIIGWALDGAPIYGPYGYSDSLNANSSITLMVSGYQLRNITDRTTLADGTVLTANQYGPSIASYALGTYVEDYEFVSGIGTLDKHNGRWCVTPEYPSGVYAYFVTEDAAGTPKYPYFIGPEYYGTTSGGSTIPVNASKYDPSTCIVTGTDNLTIDDSAEIYPNPNSGSFQISWPAVKEKSFNITIYDAKGVMVYSNSSNGSSSNLLDLDLDAGSYVVLLQSPELFASKTIIIQ